MRTRLAPALPPVVLTLALALACGGAVPRPRYAPQPTNALVAIPLPPPPARVEDVPASPGAGAVWIDGEWVLRRGRWAWSLGHWVVPAAGTFFSPWTLARGSDGTLLHAPGVWRDAGGRVVDAPKPLAFAAVQAGPVVDAEGVTETTGRTLRPTGGAPSASSAPSAEPPPATPEAAPAPPREPSPPSAPDH